MSVHLSLLQLLKACGKSVADGRLPAPDLLTKLASKATLLLETGEKLFNDMISLCLGPSMHS